MRLAEPAWLLLLLLMPLPWLTAGNRPRLMWPTVQGFTKAPKAAAGWPSWVPRILRSLAIGGLAIALARPQTVGGVTRVAAQGVAIVAVLDRSGSMAAPATIDDPSAEPLTRLDAAKETLARFVAERPDDLIGLVVFANYPDLACAPTLDHEALIAATRAVRPARAGDDGTNLGDAVAWGLDALRNVSPKKKVLILLTDGQNRPAVPEPLDPETAARLAKDLGVTLHTIAVGAPGGILRRTDPETGLPLVAEVDGPDLDLLGRMAALGGGRLFVAADPNALAAVFDELDRLERSPVQGTVRTRMDERAAPWLTGALICLVLDRLLSMTRLRTLP